MTKGTKKTETPAGKQKPESTPQKRLEDLKKLERILDGLGSQVADDYLDSGNEDAAAALTSRLVAAIPDPERKAFHTLRMGVLMERANDFESATTWYAKGISMEPQDRKVWYFLFNNMSYSLAQLGKHEEAEWHARQALQIDKERHNAHKNLGVALAATGRTEEGLEHLLTAAMIAPGDYRALGHLEELVAQDETLVLRVEGLPTSFAPVAMPHGPRQRSARRKGAGNDGSDGLEGHRHRPYGQAPGRVSGPPSAIGKVRLLVRGVLESSSFEPRPIPSQQKQERRVLDTLARVLRRQRRDEVDHRAGRVLPRSGRPAEDGGLLSDAGIPRGVRYGVRELHGDV